MIRWFLSLLFTTGLGLFLTASTEAAEKSARQRGEEAARGQPALNPATWSMRAYDEAWKQWGLKEKPADYARAFRQRYGLHAAPYDNNGLPMGLHKVEGFRKGFTTDCLLCHAGTVAGQTVVGLGNTTLDLQAMFDELSAADGLKLDLPYRPSNVRGTIDPVSPVLFLMQFREDDLSVRAPAKLDYPRPLASDPPAWWQLKKKKTRNWNGGVDARSARVDMAILLHPLNSADYIKKQEPIFKDIHAFVLSAQPPKYPFSIDQKLAVQGSELFEQHCASCHGTYGANSTYPNKIVPLQKLGTDSLLTGFQSEKNIARFNRTWLGQEKGPDGKLYQVSDTGGYLAPPLDGVWATAPYFHNSSAPTVWHVLNSKARPKFFTRSYRTEKEDYDPVKLGWKITVLENGPDPKLPSIEQRKIYDTTRPGQSNAGHPFGDTLTDEERLAVIEYLKTL